MWRWKLYEMERTTKLQWIEIYNHKLCDRTNCWNYIYLDPYDLTRLLHRRGKERNTVSQYRQSVTCYVFAMFSINRARLKWNKPELKKWSEVNWGEFILDRSTSTAERKVGKLTPFGKLDLLWLLGFPFYTWRKGSWIILYVLKKIISLIFELHVWY